MRSVLVCAAALSAAGCVSGGTWSAVNEVERELAALEEREAPRAATPARETGGDCRAIAERVVREHPRLRALRSRTRAGLARARSEGALPAPELMLEVWDFPIGDPQTADRDGMYMAGLSQEFPPAGSLDARARAAAEESRGLLGEAAEEARELRSAAFEACSTWAARALEVERLRASEDLVVRMQELLRTQLATGRASLGELARLDAESARLERMRVEAEAMRERARARLRAWLGTEDVTLPAAIDAPELPEIDLWTLARERRGALRVARARATAAAARADAAQAEAMVPTFRVSATYMQMPSMRPGLGAALSFTLPWLWSGEGAARDAARAEADAELDLLAGLERDVRAELAGASSELQAALAALRVLRERQRPAAQRALDAMLAAYPSGSVDLNAWLDAARAVRELDVEEARLLAEAARVFAELESTVGAPLTQGATR